VNRCKACKSDVKSHLKSIDFLTNKKRRECSAKCALYQPSFSERNLSEDQRRDYVQIYQNNCLWICENKLDRRYRGFWFKQIEGIKERY
jgi:hypothetical protein